MMSLKIIATVAAALVLVNCEEISDESITFWVHPGAGLPQFNSTFNESLTERGCNASGKFSIILHGWQESYSTEWVQDLISNLTIYRGGCIIVMDYSNYTVNPFGFCYYFLLVPQFENISSILLRFMQQLEGENFQFENGFMFGFSFGAQLATTTATNFGAKRFKQIDVCDPASPGFDNRPETDASLAAENVQCIHTSDWYGTKKRNCTQNWSMGVCGRHQIGAMAYPKGSHGLCPYFYTAAFKHDFIAYKNIYGCESTREAFNYPENFKMGYMEERKNEVSGDLFSPTSISWPFNDIPDRVGMPAQLETNGDEPRSCTG